MTIFCSKIEEITPTIQINIRGSRGFGKYGYFFPPEAIKHPAKMNIHLLEYLIERYTMVRDTICDPMAGTYSTCVLAALMGRNSIGVDVEDRFYVWGLEAKKRVESWKRNMATMADVGEMTILKGDARQLSQLINHTVRAIITSPPYSGIQLSGGDPEKRRQRLIEAGHNPEDFIGGRARNAMLVGYQLHKMTTNQQIGSLNHKEYLTAMLQVYKEMWKILSPEGLAIIVVKPFIRNRKVIDLPYETLDLMIRAGFKPLQALKYRLHNKSAWRRIYYRKNPHVPEIAHEYVIIAAK
ncbi:MAG: DNA methyltransferase [Candidatus Bathyarchaeia archaeon]